MLERRRRRRPRSILALVPSWCYSVLLLTTSSICIHQSVDAAATPCPTDEATVGYSDIDVLRADLESANETNFVICPLATFLLEEPILISKDNTTISCGANGKSDDQCAFFGAETQIEIQGNGSRLRGLTLIGSTSVSVWCSGGDNTTAYLEDCNLSGHSGSAALLIYNETSVSGVPPFIEDIGFESVTSMQVLVDRCNFSDNRVSLATIVNINGGLTSRNSTYYGNEGQGTVASSGRTSITGSCFGDNMVSTSTSGVVFVSELSFLDDNSDNYGDGNEVSGDGCTAIYTQDDGSCSVLTGKSCATDVIKAPSPTAGRSSFPSSVPSGFPSTTAQPTSFSNSTGDKSCLKDWTSIIAAMNNSSASDSAVSICNGTEFDFADGLEPLLINATNVTLDCPSCIFRGGSRHMELNGNVDGLVVRGIIFTEAEGETIYANTSNLGAILFDGCQWINNAGLATVRLVNPDFIAPPESSELDLNNTNSTDDDVFSFGGNRSLVGGNSSIFICKQCIFQSNSGVDGILVTYGVSTELDFVTFQSNVVEGSVIEAKSDQVSISSSCFIGNDYQEKLVIGDFSISSFSNIFGENNTRTSGLEQCVNGLGSGILCTPFDAGICFSEDNSTFNGVCISDWELLKEAVESISDGSRERFAVCEDSVLEADTPINITAGNITIQCGDDGSYDSNCTINGGESHFMIKGSSITASFAGLSFKNANSISIMAFAANDSSAFFNDCQWQDNEGGAAVLVYNEISGIPYTEENREIEKLVSSNTPAMTTTFDSCYFVDNAANFAALAVVDGNVTVSSSAFQGQSGMIAGAIGGVFGTNLSLSSSCFLDNDSITAGIVYLDEPSELVNRDRANFGSGNIAGGDLDCQDALELEGTVDTCFADGVCEGFCSLFEARTCKLPFVNYTIPSKNNSLPEKSDNTTVDASKGPEWALKPASFSAIIITNVVVIVLTMIIAALMYYRCTKDHTDPKQHNESVRSIQVPKNQEHQPLKKALEPIHENDDNQRDDSESDDDDDDEEEEDGFVDEISEQKPNRNSFGKVHSSYDFYDGGISTTSLQLHSHKDEAKKKKKLRIMKKIKRKMKKGEKKGDGTENKSGELSDGLYDSDSSYSDDDQGVYSKFSSYSVFSKNSSSGRGLS